MIPVRFEDFTDVMAVKRCTEFVGIEKLISEVGGRSAQLIALFTVAPPAQACSVVSGQRRATALAATASTGLSGGTRNHLTTHAESHQYACDQPT